MRSLELKIPPLVLMAVFALLMWGVSTITPVLHFIMAGALALGAAIAAIGGLLAALGVAEFRKARTTVDPRMPHKSEALVISGVYRISRNPMYVGFLVALAGWALCLSNVAAFLFLPLFVIYMNRYQIEPEERYMRARFGSDFDCYVGQVRRWL
ncbi:isoprenylcysteine carboxylmethyltransferase family protein [Amphritea atlantica]|uniref:Isoprenylcysteine carboxylmethyltransferase family protein n=1 Tax=Amphritea atlantica TaxID=355243 RepID=A0ABY5GXR2_9GAMM|nr:isoprenylcysteine carboxylmethyltransferase family protein [Amphritea atlantica]